jgi:hypothetical protein
MWHGPLETRAAQGDAVNGAAPSNHLGDGPCRRGTWHAAIPVTFFSLAAMAAGLGRSGTHDWSRLEFLEPFMFATGVVDSCRGNRFRRHLLQVSDRSFTGSGCGEGNLGQGSAIILTLLAICRLS